MSINTQESALSKSLNTETICAQATAPGRAGIGIVRVSGPQARQIANTLLGKIPTPRYAHYGPFLGAEGESIDVGIALFFEGPHSFTGEDVLELQGHGGPVVIDMLIERVITLGARIALPGEFSQRAFLNDKLDLTQAEAIADLINASSHAAARCAVSSLQGDFSQAVHALLQQVIRLRMYVESAIDFPEEEIDFLSEGHVCEKLDAIIEEFNCIYQKAENGARLNEGITLVIAGKPNAGKSTLLNALSGHDVAIVTDIPGTTRDVMKQAIQIDGIPMNIIDTAGLRDSDDVVEREGIRRAKAEIEKADRILWVVDAAHDGTAELAEQRAELAAYFPAHIPVTRIANKIDQSNQTPAIVSLDGMDVVRVSAKHNQGLDLLRTYLKEKIRVIPSNEGVFLARRRHLDALAQANTAFKQGREQLVQHRAGELLAYDLARAQESLNTITGEFTSDDLLGVIFSEFCVGK